MDTRQIVEESLKTAVETWAKAYFNTHELVSYFFTDEDEPERYIVILAAKSLTEWQAAEVWVEADETITINSLGEGIPPDDVLWPW
jgi:hypothetical protein